MTVLHVAGSRPRPPTPAARCVCRPDHLPDVELRIVALLAESYPLPRIAAEVGYRAGTVATYIARARHRLGAADRMQLVVAAFRLRLLGFDRDGRVVVAERGARAA